MGITLIVLLALGGAWLAYFVLWYRESRSATANRPDSIHTFDSAMSALSRPMAAQRPARHPHAPAAWGAEQSRNQSERIAA